MALPRFFITFPADHAPLEPATSFSLAFEKDAHHHITNVLRLQVGEYLEIVQRDVWATWLCEIEQVDAENLMLRPVKEIETVQQPFETILVLGFSKGDTNEKVVRQASELGISRIVPVLFARSISRPNAKKATGKVERLRKIAASAAQQSHRSDLPVIEDLMSFAQATDFLRELKPDLMLAPWEEESERSLTQQMAMSKLPDCPAVTLIIGPEGGITVDEIAQLEAIGAKSVSLGATILRVDTAAIAALAIVRAALESR